MPTPGVIAATSQGNDPAGLTWDDIEGDWVLPDGTIYTGQDITASAATKAYDAAGDTAGLTEDQRQMLGALQGVAVSSAGVRDASGTLVIDPVKLAALKQAGLKDPAVMAALSGDATLAARATYSAAVQTTDDLQAAADARYAASQRNAASAGVKPGQAYDENAYADAADPASAVLSTTPRGAPSTIVPQALDPLSINAREMALQPIDAGATSDVRSSAVAASSSTAIAATASPPTITDAGRMPQAVTDDSDIDGSTGPFNGGMPSTIAGMPTWLALLAVVVLGAIMLRSSKS